MSGKTQISGWLRRSALALLVLGGALSSAVHAAVTPSASVSLAWNANPEADIAGYKVYFGFESGQYAAVIDVPGATEVVLPPVTLGTTYYMAVSAYTSGGVEGARSQELVVTAATPEPAAAPSYAAGAAGQGTLQWRYPRSAEATAQSFTVYASEDLVEWQPAGVVEASDSLKTDDAWHYFSFPYQADKPRMFFRVGASNAFGETR